MRHLLILVVVGLLFCSCSSTKSVGTLYENVYILDRNSDSDMRVYQHTADSAQYHFNLDVTNLQYKRTSDNLLIARVKFYFELQQVNGLSSIDTMSFIYKDKVAEMANRKVRGYLPLPFPIRDTSDYILTVEVQDLHKNSTFSRQMMLRVGDPMRTVGFVNDQGVLKMQNSIADSDTVRLQSIDLVSYELEMKKFRDEFKMPLPPFSMDQLPPFSGRVMQEGAIYRESDGSYRLSCEANSIYLVTDDGNGSSYTFRQTGRKFPELSDIESMIESLQYITTREEFEKMKFADDPREAFEDFWLRCAGSRGRAKTLIAEYYHRVEEANRFFTTHVDGWKTDRGMIHIIYGPPGKVSIQKDAEVWYFGRSGDSSGLKMTFRRERSNPFSKNDFRLLRELTYKPTWYLAVDSWRGGKIVSF